MAQQTINIGTAPNDGTGTPLRTSFDYCNLNFTELYTAVGPSGNNIVVPGSATITGNLTVDTNTLFVDSANNRVGVGTASPTQILTIQGAANQAFLQANNSTAVYQAIYGVDSVAGGGVLGCISNHPVIFRVNNTEQMRLNSTGNLVLKGGTAAANGVGVTFPATQVASSDANTLDDYEEGTWTPAFTFATPGTLALTYNLQSGSYTKIGRLVTVIFRVSFAAAGIIKGTASGNLSITGLPFTVGSANVYQYVDLGSSITDITTGSFALITATGTSISFETVSTSGTRIQRDAAGLTAASFAASNAGFITISGTFTYFV
jgi:hypothetical protein